MEIAYILMLYVLEQLEFTICPFAEYGSAEGLHDLLDRHRSLGELVLRGTDASLSVSRGSDQSNKSLGGRVLTTRDRRHLVGVNMVSFCLTGLDT